MEYKSETEMNRSLIIIFLVLSLFACTKANKSSSMHVIPVKENSLANTLYYTGIIQPLQTLVITSPVDGIIVKRLFEYGEFVKINQPLFIVSSTKFLLDYKTGLMQYIKAKNDFNNSQTQLNEAKFLHRNQLISDDEFKSRQSNYYSAQLAFLQTKDSLESLLKQFNNKNINLYSLSITDIDKITAALHSQLSAENLPILASESGIALSPMKNEEENKHLNKGDSIKQGDILLLIGDLTGLKVNIKVNELVVNQLQVGQKVRITGIAFPDQELLGEVYEVNRQGDISANGTPTFSVDVIVSKLTPIQRKEIHVGMSAKVAITIQEKSNILIPLKAVSDNNGISVVNVYDAKTKTSKQRVINIGKTTMDSAMVLAGLKSGELLVIPD